MQRGKVDWSNIYPMQRGKRGWPNISYYVYIYTHNIYVYIYMYMYLVHIQYIIYIIDIWIILLVVCRILPSIPVPLYRPANGELNAPLLLWHRYGEPKQCRSCLQENHGNSVMLINFRINIIQDGVIYIYIPGPPNDCIFLVISHMNIFFGHTAYMPKFRILSCTHAGVIMTRVFSNMFPICFQ